MTAGFLHPGPVLASSFAPAFQKNSALPRLSEASFSFYQSRSTLQLREGGREGERHLDVHIL